MIAGQLSHAGSLYGGGSYSKLDYQESAGELNFTTIGAIVGTKLSNHVAIEGRYSSGHEGDDVASYDVDIKSTYGVYGRFSMDNTTNVTPYVIAGYTKAEIHVQGAGNDSADGLSVGAGVSFNLSDKLSVGVEYMSLLDKNDYDVDQVSGTLLYSF